MVSFVSRSVATWFRRWWQSRVPTRESIVVTAFLALLFEASYLAAFFVRGELLLRASDSDMILSTIGWVLGIKLVLFYWRGFCHRPWRAARFLREPRQTPRSLASAAIRSISKPSCRTAPS